MANIWQEIKESYRHGSNVTKLIYINISVFIIVRFIDVICKLFKIEGFDFMPYLEMPASTELFFSRPWTIISYMFLHFDFIHLLFNVLYLYWFGKFFLLFHNEKQLVGIYLLGGIAGGLFYITAFNFFPYFDGFKDNSFLLGASASALAITVASAVTSPNFEIKLVFIGSVKLKYLALVMILIDLLSVTSFNNGGHIAHLGGASIGFLFAYLMQKGIDITSFINKFIGFMFDLFKKKPKMKVTHQSAKVMTDIEYNKKKKEESEKIDIILDKIKKSGYDSLSADEKKALFNQSQK